MKYSYNYEYLVNGKIVDRVLRMTPKNWIELMEGPKLSYKRHIEKILGCLTLQWQNAWVLKN